MSDIEFTGDDKSDCTLLIHNVQFSYSGEYKFRFITNVTNGGFTGHPGVTLQVTDEMIYGETYNSWPFWMVVVVTAGLILVVVIYSRRHVHTEQLKEDDSDIYTTVQYNTFTMN
ncbi:hypothetical protein QTP70_014606 [Hemibagrus guttatus]|uniref:Uncharacterized protein n=1 Tax=Hemibagrus guttatus TaxID=175788 RepID=A0AAE0Q6W1_9TELE|nr:hypothetical protein QTP70_014606 [Hemibagrus guttatus]KAK3541207.1 hypothetical protein QTP86_016271 [Hemibagrus guttatus]